MLGRHFLKPENETMPKKRKKKTKNNTVPGLYRNVLAFDQNGKLCGQLEFRVSTSTATETSEDIEERLEKFQDIAMKFLSGQNSEDWVEIEEF